MLNLLKKKQNLKDVNKNIDLSENTEKIISSPSWKEWTNSIYCYNKQYIKLAVHNDKLVNYLFKSYFNLTKKILQQKRKRFNPKRFSSNRLFLSEAEIKHTNTNVNITLFLFNKNKSFMKYKLNRLETKIYKLKKYQRSIFKNRVVKVFVFNARLFKFLLYRQIKAIFHLIKSELIKINNICKNNKLSEKIIKLKKINLRNMFVKKNKKLKKLIPIYEKKNPNKKIKWYSWRINSLKKRNFRNYRFLYYYQSISFNKNKFANWFLNYRSFGIINIISKIYKKKVEFNIINLKSMHLNSNIYSQSIALKLRNRNNKLIRILKKALFKIKFPRLFDLCNIDKSTFGLILNKKDVINSMKYKLVSGTRFEASGRLTRRLIASRSIFKFRYVGSLKNIYSSFIGLPSVMLRGYLKSNIQYTMINSKTRNGAFGLKGWTSSY